MGASFISEKELKRHPLSCMSTSSSAGYSVQRLALNSSVHVSPPSCSQQLSPTPLSLNATVFICLCAVVVSWQSSLSFISPSSSFNCSLTLCPSQGNYFWVHFSIVVHTPQISLTTCSFDLFPFQLTLIL